MSKPTISPVDTPAAAPYVVVLMSPDGPTPPPFAIGVPTLSTGAWKAGIFGCWNSCVPNAGMSFFCPCVSLAQSVSRLGLHSYKWTLGVFAILYALACFPIFLPVYWERYSRWENGCLIVSCFVVLFLTVLRGRVRIMLRIPGNVVEDCCCSLFCHSCTLAQIATQVDAYDLNKCNFGPKDTLLAYTL
ncbi:PLAC8 family protein [Achlya hypogyna]|uniref:PLAC8 family protein n=1 Tax=Achlya hypogyna TaxID=1202772 RepID=A0A1V9ZRQ5_ACHHY|nr:PLAC8 family protein [Achlya hypogyna]